ncbi:MAG: polysaccharide deacetylase family protein [Planctomycetota bacterium]
MLGRLRILTYHRVGPPRGRRYEKLTVPPRRFARQLELLVRLGYGVCDLDVVPRLAGEGRCEVRRPVVLTFDDGFGEVYDYVLPKVRERKLPVVVFAVADRRAADWTGWEGWGPPPLLSPGQLREMAAAGITIGSHSRTHASLTQCSPRQLDEEVAGSKKALEDLLGAEVRHFCYPRGFYNEPVVAAVREAGYVTACTTERGAVRPGADLWRLPRLVVGKRMGFGRFLRRVLLAR